MLTDEQSRLVCDLMRAGVDAKEAMNIVNPRPYSLPPSLRPMTWATWQERFGFGLSMWATYHVGKRFGAESRWGDVTLGEMADTSAMVDGELGRVAYTLPGITE